MNPPYTACRAISWNQPCQRRLDAEAATEERTQPVEHRALRRSAGWAAVLPVEIAQPTQPAALDAPFETEEVDGPTGAGGDVQVAFQRLPRHARHRHRAAAGDAEPDGVGAGGVALDPRRAAGQRARVEHQHLAI